MILRGNRAINKINEYLEDAPYERIQWFWFSGYMEFFKNQEDDWNYYSEALIDENNNLQIFYALNFHRHMKYATLSLIVTEHNKINFFKIINYIKEKADKFKFIDYIEIRVALKNEKMNNIMKKALKRYNDLYFLGLSLNNQAKSILGEESPIVSYVYFLRNKDKYLNNFIKEIQTIGF